MRLKMPDLSNPTVRLQMKLYLGALAILVLLATPVFIAVASNSTFCGKGCHNMDPQYQTWKKSSHSQVPCYGCHVDQTIVALFMEKATAGPSGAIHTFITDHEKPINYENLYSQEHLPSVRCERCHNNDNRKFTFTRGIYMNHEAHKAAEIACAICHNRVAHKGAENYEPLKSWPETKEVAKEEGEEMFKYKDFLTMTEGCFRCHSGSPESRNLETLQLIKNGRKPPTSCATCHTADFPLPKGHGDADWRTKTGHGALASENMAYCFECHDAGAKFDNGGKAWCTLCHDQAKVDELRSQAGLKEAPVTEEHNEHE